MLSRFADFQFTPYSKGDFLGVAVAVITGQLDKNKNLARYIAERVSQRTRDVRQPIHVAQLCDTQEEVDRFERGGRARQDAVARGARAKEGGG